MATGGELYESEVLWPEAPHDVPASAPGSSSFVAPSYKAPSRRISSRKSSPSRRISSRKSCSVSSRPVDIPKAARLPRGRVDHDDGGCGATIVPPHVMVSRRRSEREGLAAFSLPLGPGRAHRDLNYLRNSVLRMTGFIEG